MKMCNWKLLFILLAGLFVMTACGGGSSSPKFGVGDGGGDDDVVSSNDGVKIISFVSLTEESLNLLGGGGKESSVVTFKVTNSDGVVLSGQTIDFHLTSTIGGTQLLGTTQGASTSGSGLVAVTVKSGTVPTSTRVVAVHRATSVEATSNAIDISSGIPSANSITVGASPSWAVESTLDVNNIEVPLIITAADNLGNPAMDGLRFTFLSPEWGTFAASSCLIVAGQCQVTWLSAYFPDKLVGDYASILAYTDGAESYQDANGNNIFDEGESWTDLGEPYVDINDNGVWETGEPWVDANKNGVYDMNGNGVWDGPCPEGDQFTCGTSSTVPIATGGRLFLCATADPDPACSNNQ